MTPSGWPSNFQPEGTELIPNLLMMAMYLCGVTRNRKIGCGLNIVPMWHPLRLAEDYAMADILTGGRVIFGVGRGYHTPRGRDLRLAAARPERQPRDVRRGRGGPVQGIRG
jgi:alkanesulfonate monooxygenase SsuD/methylene tetrahydromethanopterin reductase-like flavin-dependent oxidoreductase (luciferase family)